MTSRMRHPVMDNIAMINQVCEAQKRERWVHAGIADASLNHEPDFKRACIEPVHGPEVPPWYDASLAQLRAAPSWVDMHSYGHKLQATHDCRIEFALCHDIESAFLYVWRLLRSQPEGCAFYIGITSNPYWRWAKPAAWADVDNDMVPHQESYDAMRVVFAHNGLELGRLEMSMIAFFCNGHHPSLWRVRPCNRSDGGEQAKTYERMYLYVCLSGHDREGM